MYFKRQADKTNVNPSDAKRVQRKRKCWGGLAGDIGVFDLRGSARQYLANKNIFASFR